MITTETLTKAKNGDQNAVERICADFAPVIRRLPRTYFLLGGESDDIMQEATLGLIFAIRDYNPALNTGFETFARCCIYRRVLTAVRLASSGKHLPLNTAESIDKEEAFLKTEDDPLEILLKAEWHKFFWDTAEKLFSKTEMSVVRLYTQGFSYGEIAERLSKDAKAVDNALERARKKLKTAFEGLNR